MFLQKNILKLVRVGYGWYVPSDVVSCYKKFVDMWSGKCLGWMHCGYIHVLLVCFHGLGG